MFGWRLGIACVSVAVLGACASTRPANEGTLAGGAFTHVEPGPAKRAKAPAGKTVQDEKGPVILQMVPYRAGVSTATVERMARDAGCTPKGAAGLLTEEGPLEVYRVQCEDGRHFMAQCELRQCRPMHR